MALRIDLKVGVVHLSCGVEDHLVGVSGADPEGNGEVTVDRFLQSVGSQVWSLTQFYSVHLSQSRIGVKKCVFYRHTIKCCFRECPGTSRPSLANLTASLFLCSYGSNT